MARIRSIKPEFWDDEKMSRISLQANLLFIGMWNFSDDAGVIKKNPTWIKSKVFPAREDIRLSDVKIWIGELEQARCIIPFDHLEEGYYLIRSWKAHQKIDRPHPSKFSDKFLTDNVLNSANIRREIDEPSSPDRIGEEGIGEEVPPPLKLISEFKEDHISPSLNAEEKKVMMAGVRIFAGFKMLHPKNADLDFIPLINWMRPLREMMQRKSIPYEHIRDALNYITESKKPFFRTLILDTESLAKHFEKVRAEALENQKVA